MIFVTLGTQACDFSRCLKMIEKVVEKYQIKEKIVAQVGYTKYCPAGFDCVDFVSEEDYQQLIQSADVVVSHAGTGALFSSIKKGKKIIAVARLAKYGEMINDHQTEIVRKLTNDGYILDGTYSIENAWEQINDFIPKKSEFHCSVPYEIEETLKKWGISEKR